MCDKIDTRRFTMKIIIELINNSSFFNEIILILLGAIIGFVSSIGTIIVQKNLDKKGKLNIFYKRTSLFGSDGLPGEITDKDIDGYYNCSIPLYLELQNTSNSTRVIRDFCLILYNKGKRVDKMYQISKMHSTIKKGSEITEEEYFEFGCDKNSYSFVLPPRSIQRQQCWFEYQYKIDSQEEVCFDEVKVRYFDEKNKEKIFDFQKIDECKKNQQFTIDQEWNLIK